MAKGTEVLSYIPSVHVGGMSRRNDGCDDDLPIIQGESAPSDLLGYVRVAVSIYICTRLAFPSMMSQITYRNGSLGIYGCLHRSQLDILTLRGECLLIDPQKKAPIRYERS